MAAVNKSPWSHSVYGAQTPFRQRLKVAAGSSQAIKQGEMCYLDAGTDDVTIITATTDNLHAIVIADEEQKATDAARFMWFIIPRPGDVFNFAIASGTIAWGAEIQMNDTQTVAASATDAVAWVVTQDLPETGTTFPTVTTVGIMFKRAAAGGNDLPILGDTQGDGS